VVGTLALLAVAGASGSWLEIAARTLLQRSVPPRLIGRIFGLLEGLMMAGYAVGALLVPVLVSIGGSQLALLGVAALLPLAAAVGGRALFGLDAETPVPVVEIALLRSLPLFAELPAPALDVLHDGRFTARCARGEGVGEIALLRDIPRTATVIARTAATVYELHRDLFLTAVLGHAPTQRQADRIADARLARDGAPGEGRNQGPDAPEPG